jgi:hypothetical protein
MTPAPAAIWLRDDGDGGWDWQLDKSSSARAEAAATLELLNFLSPGLEPGSPGLEPTA